MAIRVIIHRHVATEKVRELKPLLVKLRSMAMKQPGYISGETLMNGENSEEFIVISSWTNVDRWNAWLRHEERQTLQNQIDQLLGRKTMYQVYYNA